MKRLLATTLAIVLTLSLVPVTAFAAAGKAPVTDPGQTLYGDGGAYNQVKIDVKEKSSGPYTVGDTLKFDVTFRNTGGDITGKRLKFHLYNTFAGDNLEQHHIFDNYDISGLKNSLKYKITGYPGDGTNMTGATGGLEGSISKGRDELKYRPLAGGVIFAAGGEITLTLEYGPITEEDIGKALDNIIVVYLGETDSKHAVGAYLKSSFNKVMDNGSGSQDTATLTVVNNVADGGEKAKEFGYVITLDSGYNGSGNVNDDFVFVNGKAQFTLTGEEGKNSKKVTLFKGMNYTVEETNHDGYTVEVNGSSGDVLKEQTLNGDTTVTFTNKKEQDSSDGYKLTFDLNAPADADSKYKDKSYTTPPQSSGEFTLPGIDELTFDSEKIQNSKIGKYYFAGWSTSKDSEGGLAQNFPITDIGKRSYIAPHPTFTIPAENNNKSATLYAMWSDRPGLAGYSLSIKSAHFEKSDKTTDGHLLGDNGISASTYAPKYIILDKSYSANSSSKDEENKISVTAEIPTAAGYNFIAWFNKSTFDGNKSYESNKDPQANQDPNLGIASVAIPGATVYFGDTNNIYSLDAVWGKLEGLEDADYSYDGSQQRTVAAAGLKPSIVGPHYSDHVDDTDTQHLTNVNRQKLYNGIFDLGEDPSKSPKIFYEVFIDGETVTENGIPKRYRSPGEFPTRTEVGVYEYTVSAYLENVTVENSKGQGELRDLLIGTDTATLTIYPTQSLTISKQFVGRIPVDDAAAKFTVELKTPGGSGGAYQWTKTDSSGNSTDLDIAGGSGDFTLFHDESVTVSVPANTSYTIVEYVSAPDQCQTNYTIRTVKKDGSGGEPTELSAAGRRAEGKVGAAEQVTAAFTNQYASADDVDFNNGVPKKGDLTITKKITGVSGVRVTRDYIFTVTDLGGQIPDQAQYDVDNGSGKLTFRDGSATVKVPVNGSDSGSVTISGLPAGKYKVVEENSVDPSDQSLKDLYDSPAYLPAEAVTGGVAVGESNAEVVVTNNVKTGSLKVTKAVNENGVSVPDSAEYDITVTFNLPSAAVNGLAVKVGDDETPLDGNNAVTFKLRNGQSTVISGIPVNTKYTVSEEIRLDQDIHFETRYPNGGPEGTIEESESAVTVQNTYIQVKEGAGILGLMKAVQGAPAAAPTDYAFEVRFERGNAAEADFNAFLEGLGPDAAGNTYRMTLQAGTNRIIPNIPVGVRYTVKEEVLEPVPANVVVESYAAANENTETVKGGAVTDAYAAGQIASGGDADGFIFYNQYLENLEIKKELDGEVPDGTEFKFTLRFSGLRAEQVSGLMEIEDADGIRLSDDLLPDFAEGDDAVVITLKKTGDPQTLTATVKNVPIGVSHYIITEDDAAVGSAVEYSVTGNGSDTSASYTAGSSTGEKIFTESTKSVTFRNAYDKNTGWLRIDKAVAGAPAAPAAYDFTIYKGASVVKTVTITGEGSVFIPLAQGDYTVTEMSDGSFTTTVNGTETKDAEVSVMADGSAPASVTFTNTYTAASDPSAPPPAGTLELSKTVSGQGWDGNQSFTFTVERKGGGRQTVELRDGESKKLYLTPGEYAVTETSVLGFTPSWTADGETHSGSVAAVRVLSGGRVTVAFENAWSEPYTPPDVLNSDDHFGYIVGYPDGEVKPDGSITRAEAVTILFRLLKDDVRRENWSTDNAFSDVQSSDWFNNAVSTISGMGLIKGYPDGGLAPDAGITRAELAAVISRFFDAEPEPDAGIFADVDKDAWYAGSVGVVYRLGIMRGVSDTLRFEPDRAVTRAEAIATFNRLLDHRPTADGLLENMIRWPDNADTEKWYYADVQEATNSHESEDVVIDGVLHERWTALLPMRDWPALEKEWSTPDSK